MPIRPTWWLPTHPGDLGSFVFSSANTLIRVVFLLCSIESLVEVTCWSPSGFDVALFRCFRGSLLLVVVVRNTPDSSDLVLPFGPQHIPCCNPNIFLISEIKKIVVAAVSCGGSGSARFFCYIPDDVWVLMCISGLFIVMDWCWMLLSMRARYRRVLWVSCWREISLRLWICLCRVLCKM